MRTVGEEGKVVTGGDTACVSCPCLRWDKHTHINTLCSALCVPLSAHCDAQWWVPGSCVCMWMIVHVCVFSGHLLCPLKVKYTSHDNMRLCWRHFLQWTHVDSCGHKPDIFTIYVQRDHHECWIYWISQDVLLPSQWLTLWTPILQVLCAGKMGKLSRLRTKLTGQTSNQCQI